MFLCIFLDSPPFRELIDFGSYIVKVIKVKPICRLRFMAVSQRAFNFLNVFPFIEHFSMRDYN